jgi:type I restriction enzyme S subunit
MSGWPIAPLGSVVKFLSGGTPSKDEARFWNGDIPWVSSAEMTQRWISGTRLRVTEDGAREGSKRVPKNTVLIVVRGMSLAKEFRVSISQRDVTFNQDVKAALPTKAIDSVFLFFYLLSQNNAIRDSASEAAHGTKKLDMPVLEQWPIPIPPLETQQKIAAILSAYDDLIANNQRRIALLERMAEDIYREWFVRLRFPGYQQVKLEKGVPKGWRFAELGSVCTLIKRGIAPNYSETSAALVINQRCIRDGSVDLVEARGHDTKVPTEKFVRHGDVLINSTGVGTLGRVAVFDHEATSATCDTHVTICRAKPEAASAYFLGHCLVSLQGHFESMAVGSTGQSELGREAISRTAILVPPLVTQMTFAGVVKPLWRTKRLLQRQNKALANTRDALLTRLISGKLAVDALDIRFPPGMQLADKINL